MRMLVRCFFLRDKLRRHVTNLHSRKSSHLIRTTGSGLLIYFYFITMYVTTCKIAQSQESRYFDLQKVRVANMKGVVAFITIRVHNCCPEVNCVYQLRGCL